MSNCLFCRIISKELPSQTVYENDRVIAIKDINPEAPTHILVIPKLHIDNVGDPKLLEGDYLNSLFLAVQEISQTLGLRKKGFRLVINYGQDAGEAIFHLHIHLLAGRNFNWPPG